MRSTPAVYLSGFRAFAVLLILAVVSVGCGEEDGTSTPTAFPPATVASSPTPVAATPTTAADMPTATATSTATATPTRDPFYHAPAPTHTEPTPWGLFVINPVIDGQSLLNPQTSPVPDLSGPSAKRLEVSGPTALEQAANAGVPWVKVPAALVAGMELNGVFSAVDGGQFSFSIGYFAGKGTPDVRSIVVQGFTPTEPVTFEEFPDNAIQDFSASHDVRGYPTLTVFPDKGTADPRSERVVAWSQDRAVYYVKTTGLFRDEDVLEIAREISIQREGQ